MIQYLLDQGFKPSDLHIDNKCPKAPKHFLREKSVDFQLLPPNNILANQEDKSIETWKCHFLAGHSGVYPNIPLHIWCRLLTQATQTLNLLHRSRINLRLSADAQLYGAFDYNRTPMAPSGTKFFMHETLQQRCTWDYNGK